jgi:hypothetical protein
MISPRQISNIPGQAFDFFHVGSLERLFFPGNFLPLLESICYPKRGVHKVFSFCAGLWLCGLLGGVVRAETLQLNDGQSASGDIVSFNENGLVLRLSDGKYSDRIPWGKFSQEDLRKFAENPKMATFVEPFI